MNKAYTKTKDPKKRPPSQRPKDKSNPRSKRPSKPSKKKDDCFITTACVEHNGLGDNCYQLTTIRNFRDSYLLSSPDLSKLVKDYYLIAPKIVNKIKKEKDAALIFELLFEKINMTCILIKEKKFDEAVGLYTETVQKLKATL